MGRSGLVAVRPEREGERMKTSDSSSMPDPVAWLKKLSLGEPQELEPYTIYPLCVEKAGSEPNLLLTHQAIGALVLEILEKGEGDVQELEALNKGQQPVVILEGDTLVGCKQNRVVARSVILGRGGKVAIPVGCMEQGRWERRSTSRTGASPGRGSGTTTRSCTWPSSHSSGRGERAGARPRRLAA
jgi:hypothetical protein